MTPETVEGPQGRAWRAGIPYRVHFIVTHKCNLRCEHCYQAEHDSNDLSTARVFEVLRDLAALGVFQLTLGGGEPMARRDFWEILAEARRLRFFVELYTNATLIDEEAADRLKALGILQISLSLHGAEAETHDAFVRRRGAFDRVNRAMDLLEARGIAIVVKSSVTKENHREMPRLSSMVRTRRLMVLSENVTIHARDDGDRSPLGLRLTEEQEREVVRRELLGLDAAKMQKLLDGAARKTAGDPSTYAPCHAARSTLTIQPNGDVTPCNQTPGLVMGNVGERPIAEIWWSSEAGDRFRAISVGDFIDARAECRACPFNKVCHRCVAKSLSDSGSMTGFSPQKCQSTQVYWTEVRKRAAELGLACPV